MEFQSGRAQTAGVAGESARDRARLRTARPSTPRHADRARRPNIFTRRIRRSALPDAPGVDTGATHADSRGVRGRANARVIDGEVGLAVDVTRKVHLKYTGTDKGPTADEMLEWAHEGGMSVFELTPLRLGAFKY